MADHNSKADFNAMSVVELKKYLQERRISASGYLKTSLVEITSAITSSARGSKFRKGDTTVLDELIIHSILIPNPFFLKAVNNFNASQPFGFYDIFNYLICSSELIAGSTLRFKRALATACSSVKFTSLTIKCQKGFSQGKLSCISLCLLLVRKMSSVYDWVATPRHGIYIYPKDKTMI